MSHDRKPGRVRVMEPAATSPQRRRHDGAPFVIDAASGGRVRRATRRSQAMLIALFLLAAIASGSATELYLPV